MAGIKFRKQLSIVKEKGTNYNFFRFARQRRTNEKEHSFYGL